MSKRRMRRGSGSLTYISKSQLWQGAISTPQGRVYVWAKTERECLAKIRKAQSNVDQGRLAIPSKQTLVEYLTGYKSWPALDPNGKPLPPQGWLGQVAKLRTRPNVWRVYESIIRVHIIPSLGKKKLASLSSRDIQLLYAAKSTSSRYGEDRKPLSSGTIKHIQEVLHNALQVAVDAGDITTNVCDAVRLPRITRKESQVLTLRQARALLSAIINDPFEALYILVISTGLRQSELLGLMWSDVHLAPPAESTAIDEDREPSHIHVKQNIQRVNRVGFVKDEPKSVASKRSIALTIIAVDALQRHRLRQLETRLAAGPLWCDNDLVFSDSLGQPIAGSNLTRYRFKPMLRRAGLPDITFYDLRHSVASLLNALGTDIKVIQQILGHSNVSTTLGIYTHPFTSSHLQAIDKLGSRLMPNPYDEPIDESPGSAKIPPDNRA